MWSAHHVNHHVKVRLVVLMHNGCIGMEKWRADVIKCLLTFFPFVHAPWKKMPVQSGCSMSRWHFCVIQDWNQEVWSCTTIKKLNLGRLSIHTGGHLGWRVVLLGLGLNADGHSWLTLQLSHLGAIGLHICSSGNTMSSNQANWGQVFLNTTGQ